MNRESRARDFSCYYTRYTIRDFKSHPPPKHPRLKHSFCDRFKIRDFKSRTAMLDKPRAIPCEKKGHDAINHLSFDNPMILQNDSRFAILNLARAITP